MGADRATFARASCSSLTLPANGVAISPRRPNSAHTKNSPICPVNLLFRPVAMWGVWRLGAYTDAMPNGFGAPQCSHCKHWIPSQRMRELFGDEEPDALEMSDEESEAIDRQLFPADGHLCSLHSFVFPVGGGEIVCADFEWAGSGSPLEPHLRMDKGLLYHHSYASHKPATAIGRFKDLQHQVWHVSLSEEELGWVVRVPLDDPEDDPRTALPIVGSRPPVQIGSDVLEFVVVRESRSLWCGTSYESGQPVKRYEVQDTQMWHCPASPQAMGDWVKSHIDFDSYVQFWRSKGMEEMLEIGLSQWLFQTEDGFRLQFDYFQTGEYALEHQL